MACQTMQMWRLSDLVAAFLDLSIAYLLLCASALAFLGSKFLGFFGFKLPCPCNGLFLPRPNKELCLSRLLIDLPIQLVSNVHVSVREKFPFNDSINKNLVSAASNYGNNTILEMEGDASSSSDARTPKILFRKDFFAREENCDVKGKEVIDHRPRSRRRKGTGGRGRYLSMSSSNPSLCDLAFGGEVHSSDDDDDYSDEERARLPVMRQRSLSSIQVFKYPELPDNHSTSGDDKLSIRLLEEALEEEQAARAVLYVELEKERSAAASAADEAMAMIMRLQEEKAFVEMESRQYQNILEEKSAYDAEEMDILKEILLRREREKLFLEKEVEAYRQIVSPRNELSEGDLNDDPISLLHHLASSNFQKSKEMDNNLSYTQKGNPISVEGKESDEETIDSRSEFSNSGEKDSPVHDVHVITDCSAIKRSNSDISNRLPPKAPKGKPLLSDLRRKSMTSVDCEMLKIDYEVGRLRERLKVVQEEREKLSFPVEKENVQLRLLEDISRQVQEIRSLTEAEKTARRVSLPLPTSKFLSKTRRCRSASSVFQRNAPTTA